MKSCIKISIIVIVVIVAIFAALIGFLIDFSNDDFSEIVGLWQGIMISGEQSYPLTLNFTPGDATPRGYMRFESPGFLDIENDTYSNISNNKIHSENDDLILEGQVGETFIEGTITIEGRGKYNFKVNKVE